MTRQLLKLGLFLVFGFIGYSLYGQKQDQQVVAVRDLINRILPDHANSFELQLIPKDKGSDVFEIASYNNKVVIKGSNGISLASGFNHYLKKVCSLQYTWRGEHLKPPKSLPLNFKKIKKVSPHEYRYMFNYCVFSYSTAFWGWDDWEKIIDWMAMNGINTPLALSGQELIWQRVFEKQGLTKEEMSDFFVGPAYNAFGRMGGLDGFGGPLPQSWIEQEAALQHKILKRERSFGMTPVLQGFAGHVPQAFVNKYPKLKVHRLSWCDFPETNMLDWEEEKFTEIATDFIKEMRKEYGTDHLYAIDPFNEMNPAKSDLHYLRNMGSTLFEGMNKADPKGKWLLMTWTFKNPEIETGFWQKERTKAFFEGVPDDRMLALELHGESWKYTGWYKLDSYFGKPWIWGIIQNFGDRVGMYGDLAKILDHYNKAVVDPNNSTLSGIGIFMEGLGYNPIVYELMAELMWEKDSIDLEEWKWSYVKNRYGKITPEVRKAWENIFDYFYTKEGIFTGTVIMSRPTFDTKSVEVPAELIAACKHLLAASADFHDNDAYQFDLVNLFREALGAYGSQLLQQVNRSFDAKNSVQYQKDAEAFLDYITDVDDLLATRQEFLLGKWVNDARSKGLTKEESDLYEWNAKSIISLWGPKNHPGCGGLHGYAMKQWSGFFSDYCLPSWKLFFTERLKELKGERKFDHVSFYNEIADREEAWLSQQRTYRSSPVGDPAQVAQKLWNKYDRLKSSTNSYESTMTYLSLGKKTSSSKDLNTEHGSKQAVDGVIDNNNGWKSPKGKQHLIIDLEKIENVFGFQVYFPSDGLRTDQYMIQISDDANNWRTVIDMRRNSDPNPVDGFKHIFKTKFPEGVSGRYIKIQLTPKNHEQESHLIELKVFNNQDISRHFPGN